MRLSYENNAMHLRDFQLCREAQGKGVGKWCLESLIQRAKQDNFANILLRVYSENPAINLYKAKGFVVISEIDSLIEMELIL